MGLDNASFVPMGPTLGDYGMLQTWSRGALRPNPDILLRTLYVASNRNQTEEKEKSSYFVIIKQDREKLESLFFFG